MYKKDNIIIYNSDCLDVLPTLCGGSAIITDPPYGLAFMGKKWDYDVPSVELWEAALKALKPGGHLLAFAGTRTYHRMTVNIEDAGFTIRDMVAWVYGTGFPKSSKKGLWGGYGTALKPAHEPICVAMKPLDGTFANNALEHGVAGLNIDRCRVGTEIISTHSRGKNTAFPKRPTETTVEESGRVVRQDIHLGKERQGRWPANLIHDGSEEVLENFPSNKSSGGTAGGRRRGGKVYGKYQGQNLEPIGFGDKGSTSRFFYCAKANKKERGEGNNHPTVKPIALMRYLLTLVTYPEYNLIIDPFMGSGTTALACLELGLPFIGIEKEKEYYDLAIERIERELKC